jgi:hypothetical protein
VTPFDLGQVTQELPDARITDLTDGPFVKATGLSELDRLVDAICGVKQEKALARLIAKETHR